MRVITFSTTWVVAGDAVILAASPVSPTKRRIQMALVNPFAWLSPVAQKRAFIFLVVLGLVIQYAWNALDGPLKTEAAPKGVLSLEVAGTTSRAQAIVASWGPEGEIRAAANTGLDYLFLVVYGSAIALGQYW
jgi:hypothetical protein